MPDILVTSRRDAKAATSFFRKLEPDQQTDPGNRLTTAPPPFHPTPTQDCPGHPYQPTT